MRPLLLAALLASAPVIPAARAQSALEGWLQQPTGTGPVLFSNSSPTYTNLTLVGGGGETSIALAPSPARGHPQALPFSEELAEHLRSEFSTFTWLLEPMLERTGFEIVEREVRASIYATYTCRRR